MEIRYTHKAVEDFENLPRDVQKRIAEKMRFYAAQKDPLRFAGRLVDSREGEFRFRVAGGLCILRKNQGSSADLVPGVQNNPPDVVSERKVFIQEEMRYVWRGKVHKRCLCKSDHSLS